MATDRIVSFYAGGRDDRGRTLETILGWSDDQLEAVHDYIQWLFPARIPSAVNPSAPLVTRETIAAFVSPALRDRLRCALDRMLTFYGLRRDSRSDGELVIAIDDVRFPERAANWLRPGDHNHLRLTRIIQSLAALGLEPEAKALQRCLITDVYEGAGRNRITPETLAYWMRALDQR